MLALVAAGQQDAYCNHNDAYYDACDALTRSSSKSISCYRKLDYDVRGGVRTCTTGAKRSFWQFSIKPTCTFVNELDIIFSNSNASKSVVAFETEVGGSRIDRVGRPGGSHEDFLIELSASCAMFGVPPPTHDAYPVCMAPFYRFNAMSKSLIEWHDVLIRVHFSCELSDDPDATSDANVVSGTLMGVCHFVAPNHKIYTLRTLEFNTLQHQLVRSPEDLPRKKQERWDAGSTFVNLCFNHPVYAIYFWGHDPHAAYRVSLTLNSTDIFVEPIPIGALRRRARARGLRLDPGVDVVLFANGVDFSKRPSGLINFSRIDESELVLLDGPKCAKLRVVALNLQPVRIMQGMCGLAFSK